MSNDKSNPEVRAELSQKQKNSEAALVAGNAQSQVEVVDVNNDNNSSSEPTDDPEEPPNHRTHPEAGIPDAEGQNVELAVMQVEYTTRERGDESYPVLHIFGRSPDGDGEKDNTLEHIEVHDFEPYFYVPEGQLVKEVKADSRVTRTKTGYESIRGTPVVRAYTKLPKHVGQMKGDLDEHYEADILFPNRFLIDKDIFSGVRVPQRRDEDGDIIVKEDEFEPIELTATPRVNIFDIEVEDRNGFPEDGEEEIICITSYDNYDEEYVIWAAEPETDVSMPDSLPEYSPIEQEELNYRIEVFSDEVRMLVDFLDYIERTDPDVLTGWNFEDFDATYLIDRLDVLNEKVDSDHDDDGLWRGRLSRLNVSYTSNWGPTIKGRVVLDLLYAYKRTQFSEKESYRLDAIGADELGAGKEHYSGDIGDLWENNPERLLEYNLRDVEICRELDQQQEIIQFWDEVRTFVGCLLEDAPTPSDACDMYVLHKVQGAVDSDDPEFVLPSKGQAEYEDYEGGAVFDPISGVRENVTVLDLKSLYPMCMVSINASPETKVENPAEYGGETYKSPPIELDGEKESIHFKKDEDGIIRDIIDELLSEREQKKTLRNDHSPDSEAYEKFDRQQGAVKVIMNSLYGVLGWERFRLYDKAMGAAVTATGRGVINFTETVVEEEDLDVTYGDTDSVMLELGDVNVSDTALIPPEMKDAHPDMSDQELKQIAACIKLSETLEETINNRYDDFAQSELNINLENGEEHRFQIEFEKLYRRFFQAGKKKRYAGHIVYKEGKHLDNIDITGFESERSDIAPITKTAQIKVLNMICTGVDNEEIKEYLHELIEDVRSGNISKDDVGIPGGIGKNLDNYDTDTAQVRGAKYANLLLGTNFGNGSKPKRLYLKKVHPDFWHYASDELALDPQQDPLYGEFKRNPDVICYEYEEDLPEELEVDWDKMLNKTLQSPISRVITSIGLTWADVKSGQTQTGLANFM